MAAKIGVALIGSGNFVRDEHLPAVLACHELDLKAVYSRSLQSAQSLTGGLDNISLYSDDSAQSLADLLARADIHAVIIVLPIPLQPEFIKRALSAGKHVLAEKPLAPDVATALALLEWCAAPPNTPRDSQGGAVTLSLAENFRFTTVWTASAARVAAAAAAGHRVQSFYVRMHTAMSPDSKYHAASPWRQQPQHQGGYILDIGVHFAAALRLMLGPHHRIRRVAAFATRHQPHFPPLDSVEAVLQLEDGRAAGTLSLSVVSGFQIADCGVAWAGGSVAADMIKGEVTVRQTGQQAETEPIDRRKSNVLNEVEAWVRSLGSGVPDEGLSPREGLADVEVIEAILESAQKGGMPVDLRHQI